MRIGSFDGVLSVDDYHGVQKALALRFVGKVGEVARRRRREDMEMCHKKRFIIYSPATPRLPDARYSVFRIAAEPNPQNPHMFGMSSAQLILYTRNRTVLFHASSQPCTSPPNTVSVLETCFAPVSQVSANDHPAAIATEHHQRPHSPALFIARSATSAINAAPTPLPSFAIPMRIRFSPSGPMRGISRKASRMYSSKLG